MSIMKSQKCTFSEVNAKLKDIFSGNKDAQSQSGCEVSFTEVTVNVDEDSLPVSESVIMGAENDLRRNLASFQTEGYLCDTSLVCDDGEVKVHGVVMAATSPVIRASLATVAEADAMERTLIFPGVTVSLMKIAIQFAYSGELLIPCDFNSDIGITTVVSLLSQLGLTAEPSTRKLSGVATITVATTQNRSLPTSNKNDNDVSPHCSEIETSATAGEWATDDASDVVSGSSMVPSQADNIHCTEDLKSLTETGLKHHRKKAKLDTTNNDLAAAGKPCDAKFMCAICGATYLSAAGLRFHRKSHESPFQTHRCEECGINCSTRGSLTRHMKQHTGERPYLCQYCGQGFIVRERMLDHVSQQHSGLINVNDQSALPFHCKKCGDGFSRSSELWRHNKFLCSERLKVEMTSSEEKKQSASFGTPDTQPLCDICEEKQSSQLALAVHKRKHAGGLILNCPLCVEEFLVIRKLQEHLNGVHGSRTPFICEFCNSDFLSDKALYTHRRTYHLKRESLTCRTCGKLCQSRPRLIDHERVHSGEKPFQCETCGEHLRTERELQYHHMVHSADRLYKCETCGKSFLTAKRLMFHGFSHSLSKLYECSQCDQKFYISSHLYRHMRTHTGERPFACTECDKAYKTRHDLRLHMKSIHRMELPWISNRIKLN